MPFLTTFPVESVGTMAGKDNTLRSRILAGYDLLGFGLHMSLPEDDENHKPSFSAFPVPQTEDECCKRLEEIFKVEDTPEGAAPEYVQDVLAALPWAEIVRLVLQLLELIGG